MSDAGVAALLRSDQRLVVIEAAAGCGKTYQGASYAKDAVSTLGSGRLLILTHTHAACSVFAERTRDAGGRVEIKTIDALVMQVATAYHQVLDLPPALTTWAWRDNGRGFSALASKVAALMGAHPMIPRSLAVRYPIVICDEHQDSSIAQHDVVMALYQAGATVRIFGDPMQRIFGERTPNAAQADEARWNALKEAAGHAVLETPHRWRDGCTELGDWVQRARERLRAGEPVDLSQPRPDSVKVFVANNIASHRRGYALSRADRRPIDRLVEDSAQLLVLASQNELVSALRAFWFRRLPIWEGHTRDALATFVTALREAEGDANQVAQALIEFMSGVAVGFSRSDHGRRLLREVQEGCGRTPRGTSVQIQAIARHLVEEPSFRGAARALELIAELIDEGVAGFAGIKIDHRTEFREAARLGSFSDVEDGFAEIARRRSYARPSPPTRALSSIHKAKGLECDHAMIMACDSHQFSTTPYSRCKLYVALSRAKTSLTLVVPDVNLTPLFRL